MIVFEQPLRVRPAVEILTRDFVELIEGLADLIKGRDVLSFCVDGNLDISITLEDMLTMLIEQRQTRLEITEHAFDDNDADNQRQEDQDHGRNQYRHQHIVDLTLVVEIS